MMGLVPSEEEEGTPELSLSLYHVRIQPEGSHLHSRKRVPQNETCQNLDLGLPSLQNCEKSMSVV